MLRERRRHAHYKLNTRLDRKSSRGMIYENEELRLRTININAEVERGQTDIKRLRKENEQLRREIWTLRDECDRLNKRVKAKFIEHEHAVSNVRCSENGCLYYCKEGEENCDCQHNNSEDSDSCDSCCCHEEDENPCNDDCCNETKNLQDIAENEQTATGKDKVTVVTPTEASATSPSKLTNFDHLSVVSEETLSNSEVVSAQQAENLLGYVSNINSSQITLPGLVRPLTPLTPIDLVANELNDLQAVMPPLSYFENILQQHVSPNYDSNIKVVQQTNGWDYNLKSPFTQKRYQTTSISPVLAKRSPAQTLTTFVPTTAKKTPLSLEITSNNSPTLLKNTTVLTSSNQQGAVIETVPIITMPPNGCVQQHTTSPTSNCDNDNVTTKHFFAPIKPKLKLNTALANQKRQPPPPPPVSLTHSVSSDALVMQTKCEPPDIYVTNGLATPYRPPNKPTVQPPPIPQRTTSTSALQAQTDSANLESILNDIEAISEDILAIQLEKNKPRENINKSKSKNAANATEHRSLQQSNKNTKPYRSEMNLLLSYECDGPTNKTVDNTVIPNNNSETLSNTNTIRRARSLERDHIDSPSPNIPAPMKPFPENRKYIGFDRLNKAALIATNTAPYVTATATQTYAGFNPSINPGTQLPPSPLITNVSMSNATNVKNFPPTPPGRSTPVPLNIKCAGIARKDSVTNNLPAGVLPNKSQLYADLANAAAKRAQFRTQPTHLTRSFDKECNMLSNINENCVNNANYGKEGSEDAVRKSIRTSPIDNDIESPATSENHLPAVRLQVTNLQVQHPASGSCSNLPSVLPNPALRNLKHNSQSTPNSPHSSRKYEEMPPTIPASTPTISVTPTSTPQHTSSSHANAMTYLNAHNSGHSNSYPNVVSPLTQHQHPRKNSQDAIKASATEIASATANVVRSKCSRRHSESTVIHTNHRISGTSSATNGGHHRHHHHHQHSSSLASNANPHHSHHSRQDSNHETVASFSDGNSNSLASSRESSASLSIHSQRRKLSISSHSGGKIPWCGCWGNGCL